MTGSDTLQNLLRILNEIHYFDRFPEIGRVAYQYPDSYIHFSEVPKLGVHPKPGHRDPYGVYFYPMSYLEEHDFAAFSLYRSASPYAFVADLDLTGDDGVHLSHDPWEKLRAIAERNGWGEYLDRVWNDPYAYLRFYKNGAVEYLVEDGNAGAAFYATADILVNDPKLFDRKKRERWSRLLRGVAFLNDDGDRIIHPAEPAQVCVRDPRLIRVREMVVNREGNYRAAFSHELFRRLGVSDVRYTTKDGKRRGMEGTLRVSGVDFRILILNYDNRSGKGRHTSVFVFLDDRHHPSVPASAQMKNVFGTGFEGDMEVEHAVWAAEDSVREYVNDAVAMLGRAPADSADGVAS